MTREDSERPERRADSVPDDTTFRLFVESVQDYAIFMLDIEGRVASWNAGAERIKGYREHEILGQHFSRFYPPEEVARGWPAQELEVASREGRLEDEGWRVRKDGTRFWANVVITAVRDDQGHLRGFAKVTRDMTERRRAAEQAVLLMQEEAARAEAQRSGRRLQSLVDISRALAEAGLEFEAVAETIARRLAELVGDGCVVRVVRGEALVPVAHFHTDPEAGRVWARLLGTIPLERETVLARAVRTRQSVIESGVDLPSVTAREFPGYGEFVDRFPPSSIMATPILGPAEKAVGVISLIRSRNDAQRHSDEDRLIVEAVAFRSALALSNATLYREAREAHADAEQAHEQLRLTFEAMAEGVIVQNRAGRIVMANDAGARLCGYPTAKELLAVPISDAVARFEIFDEHGAPFPLEKLPARRALEGEPHAEAIMRWRPRGGTTDRWSVSKATPARGADGEIQYAISVVEDVTDRRRLFERLEFLSDAGEILASSLAYEQTLTAVAQLAVPRIADWCGIDMCDDLGRVRRLALTHVDPAKVVWAEELNRRYPVELEAPKGIGAVLRTGDSQLISEITDELLAASARDPEHLQILHQIGLRSYICVPLIAKNRTIGALTLVATEDSGRRYDDQDLTMAELLGRRAGLAVENARLYTETHVALDKVMDISRTKDEFLATLSHELRTPLNAIVGWTNLLQSGKLNPDLAAKAIVTIARNANLQTQLISDMVDVSRIVTGKVRLDVRPIDPVAVIENALDTVRPAAEARDIQIEAVLDSRAGPISGDADRLQQVVWNLLANAIKFAPKGGRVHVRLEAVNSHVEIVVEDNGPGIPVDFLPHVFERFRQADSSSTRGHKGLGLGLAIVRHLVELHGGQVRAENRAERTGAVFTVSLPRRAVLSAAVSNGDPAVSAPGAVSEPAPSLGGIRVMLVDDEPDARELLRVGLEQGGAEVIALESAAEVQRQLAVHRPHVLLADIEMAGTDGYTLLRQLRARRPEDGGLTPAIAITAYAGAEDRIRALSAGFDLHLSKPVQLSELRVAVARLAGQRR